MLKSPTTAHAPTQESQIAASSYGQIQLTTWELEVEMNGGYPNYPICISSKTIIRYIRIHILLQYEMLIWMMDIQYYLYP